MLSIVSSQVTLTAPKINGNVRRQTHWRFQLKQKGIIRAILSCAIFFLITPAFVLSEAKHKRRVLFYVGNAVSLAQSLVARHKALINGLLQELQPKIKPLQPASVPAGGTADLLTRISSLTLEDEEPERKTTQP